MEKKVTGSHRMKGTRCIVYMTVYYLYIFDSTYLHYVSTRVFTCTFECCKCNYARFVLFLSIQIMYIICIIYIYIYIYIIYIIYTHRHTYIHQPFEKKHTKHSLCQVEAPEKTILALHLAHDSSITVSRNGRIQCILELEPRSSSSRSWKLDDFVVGSLLGVVVVFFFGGGFVKNL